MARANSFEGSTDETTVTTGNSGGGSGSAFDSVSVGTGATVVYDNAQSALGTFSCRIGTTGTSSLAYVGWTLASVASDYSRALLRLTSLPSAAAQPVVRYLSGAGQSFRVNVKSAGTIEVRDAGNSVVGTTTAAITAGQFWRLELHPVFSTTVGAVELRYYASPNSTGSPTETLTLTGLTLTANATEVRWGVGAALANAVSTWFDNVATEGTTWFGPALVNGTGLARATTFGTAAAGTRTVLGTAGRATTFGTAASGTRTVLGTAGHTTTFTPAAAGIRTTFGTADRTTTFSTTAEGVREVLGTAARETVFGTAASGIRTVLGSAARPIVFATTAEGYPVLDHDPTAILTASVTSATLAASTTAADLSASTTGATLVATA